MKILKNFNFLKSKFIWILGIVVFCFAASFLGYKLSKGNVSHAGSTYTSLGSVNLAIFTSSPSVTFSAEACILSLPTTTGGEAVLQGVVYGPTSAFGSSTSTSKSIATLVYNPEFFYDANGSQQIVTSWVALGSDNWINFTTEIPYTNSTFVSGLISNGTTYGFSSQPVTSIGLCNPTSSASVSYSRPSVPTATPSTTSSSIASNATCSVTNSPNANTFTSPVPVSFLLNWSLPSGSTQITSVSINRTSSLKYGDGAITPVGLSFPSPVTSAGYINSISLGDPIAPSVSDTVTYSGSMTYVVSGVSKEISCSQDTAVWAITTSSVSGTTSPQLATQSNTSTATNYSRPIVPTSSSATHSSSTPTATSSTTNNTSVKNSIPSTSTNKVTSSVTQSAGFTKASSQYSVLVKFISIVPEQPNNLQISDISSSGALLSWNEPSNSGPPITYFVVAPKTFNCIGLSNRCYIGGLKKNFYQPLCVYAINQIGPGPIACKYFTTKP